MIQMACSILIILYHYYSIMIKFKLEPRPIDANDAIKNRKNHKQNTHNNRIET